MEPLSSRPQCSSLDPKSSLHTLSSDRAIRACQPFRPCKASWTFPSEPCEPNPSSLGWCAGDKAVAAAKPSQTRWRKHVGRPGLLSGQGGNTSGGRLSWKPLLSATRFPGGPCQYKLERSKWHENRVTCFHGEWSRPRWSSSRRGDRPRGSHGLRRIKKRISF